MFENFENFKKAKTPFWVIPLVGVAITAHVAFGAVVIVKEMWAAPLLDVPVTPLEVAVAPAPP
ncbi:MAG TPA: hypothetical protein VM734_25595, partial [Kofleriaceae bacterium]|nr:hypothetical protein [Kofleriaceae bacterium]